MKKIIALALALIMVLSMGTVAFATPAIHEVNTFAAFEELLDGDGTDDAADGDTIKLTADINGHGIVIKKAVTIDFNGKTFTIDRAPTVGSPGTQSQGIQILANTATFMNGTITSTLESRQGTPGVDRTGIAVLVNNYADLELIDMELATTNANYYTLQIRPPLSSTPHPPCTPTPAGVGPSGRLSGRRRGAFPLQVRLSIPPKMWYYKQDFGPVSTRKVF